MRKPSNYSQHFVVMALALTALISWAALSNSFRELVASQAAQAVRLAPLLAHRTKEGERVSLRAAGRSTPSIKLRDSQVLPAVYAGAAKPCLALEQNLAQPLALAAADFDEDGVPDLLSAYAAVGRGALALHRGNVDALFPHSLETQQRKASGQFTAAPFLSAAQVWEAPEAPDFVATGDFDADGHPDIVTAARGGHALYLLPGDGRGGFGAAQPTKLPGSVTALASGEVNQADGLIDLAVGIMGSAGPQVLVFESPNGALRGLPEVFALPNAATALAVGRLDDDQLNDLAVAAGHHLLMIKGRERRLSLDETRRAEVKPALLSKRVFPAAITDLALGDFNGAQRSKLALLFDDGTVQMLRPDSAGAAESSQPAELGQWQAREVLSSSRTHGSRTQLMRARLSTQPGEDLVIVDFDRLHIVAGGAKTPDVALAGAGALTALLPLHLNADALNDLVFLRSGQSAPTIAFSAPAAIFTVTNANDSGPNSLRDAITQANAMAGADTINFAIGSGLQTINLLSALPALTETVTIDGTTQPGFAGAPLIELRGSNAGPTARGLQIINVANCLIKGLVINGFAKTGMFISGAGASGNQVQGCYIGTNAAGTAAVSNGTNPTTFDSDGLDLVFGAHDNTIGGTTAGARNLISGNSGGGAGDGIFIAFPGTNNNLIQGNYLGLNAAGTAAIANGFGGVEIATDVAPGPQGNIIGGTAAGAGNVASGNGQVGVGIFNADSNNNIVQGNFIGTNAAGTGAVPNGVTGAEVGNPPGGGVSAKNNLIGGTTPSARNILSGNSGNGVWIRDAGTTNNLVQGNYAGLNAAGTAALPNSFRGVELAFGAQNNTVGGTVAGTRNILSGNAESGVAIFNPGTNGNFVQGNYIGLNAAGTAAPAKREEPHTSNGPATSFGLIQSKFGNANSSQRLNTLARANTLNATAPSAIGNILGVMIRAGAQNNVIGGTTAGSGNVISGNANDGLLIFETGTNNNLVQGNFIGTNPAGTSAVPNGAGVEISFGAQGNTIGGTAAGAGNLISGNGGAVTFPNGILIGSPGTNNNRVLGNLIGTQADGINPLGNASHGIALLGSIGSGNSIGAPPSGSGNAIAFNGGAGVFADSGVANTISGNSIFSNSGLGIDLAPLGVTANDNCDGDTGPNNLQNFPVLTAATSGGSSTMIQGTLNSAASATFTLEFFANPACDASGNGEGKTFIGSRSVTTNASCMASFNVSFPTAVPAGQVVTATVTDAAGNTSEFSACIPVILACTFAIAPTNQTFTASGGSDMVTVTSPSGCNWTAVSNNPSFITITSGSSGSGNGPVSYMVDANPTASPRTGTLTIAGQTFTVNQSGITCAGLISPTSASFSATGGTGNVMVPAPTGCNWMAASNDAWLTITSGSPGNGNGTVGYNVAVNPGATRSGTLTIAGQLFTVTQTGGLMFYPLPTPVRLLDTRAGQGNCDSVGMPIAAGTSITTQARINCEGIPIPASAQAVAGNITVINQSTQAGYLTLYPNGVPTPLAANMIYYPGQILSNAFTVGLSATGEFNIFGQRTIDVVVDISGYYAPPGAGGLYFHPLPRPLRLLDTRAGAGNCDSINAPIAAGTSLTTQARIMCEGLTIPAAAQALAGNATVINLSNQAGYLTLYPDGVAAPLAANLVYQPNQILANAFTVSLSAGGAFNSFAQRSLELIVDVAGYYSAEASDVNGPGLLFNPLPRPVRLLDTRAGEGNCDNINAPIAAGTSLTTQARITCEGLTIPGTAQTVLGNVTVINLTGEAGYLTLYPNGVGAPLAANLIYYPGQVLSNAFVVGLSGAGEFNIFGQRMIEAIVDVSGYFAP